MSFFDEILGDERGKRLLEEECLIVEVTERVCELMEEKGVSQSELAKKLGVKAPRVSRMLSGDANITLRTLANIGSALGEKIHVFIGDQAQDRLTHLLTKTNSLRAHISFVEKSVNGMNDKPDSGKVVYMVTSRRHEGSVTRYTAQI